MLVAVVVVSLYGHRQQPRPLLRIGSESLGPIWTDCVTLQSTSDSLLCLRCFYVVPAVLCWTRPRAAADSKLSEVVKAFSLILQSFCRRRRLFVIVFSYALAVSLDVVFVFKLTAIVLAEQELYLDLGTGVKRFQKLPITWIVVERRVFSFIFWTIGFLLVSFN